MLRSSILLSVAKFTVFATSLSAQEYVIAQPIGSDNFGSRSTGQSFTPGVGAVPDPGTLPVLPLEEITLHQGNSGATSPSATTYLNIYDGDPNAGGNFVGSSQNSVDTTSLQFRTPMTWTFPYLPLATGNEYWAVMSSTPTAGTLDVAASLETEPRTSPNRYTGGTGLIANIARHPASIDCRFEMVFFLGVRGRFTTNGAGCANSTGTAATLSSPNTPAIGQNLTIDMAGTAATALPVMIVGFSDQLWGGFSLPYRLDNLLPGAAPECLVFCSVNAVLPMTPGSGSASITLPIPTDPALSGGRFFAQGWQFEPAGVSLSNLAEALIGS